MQKTVRCPILGHFTDHSKSIHPQKFRLRSVLFGFCALKGIENTNWFIRGQKFFGVFIKNDNDK